MEDETSILQHMEELWKKNYPGGIRRELSIPERTLYSVLQDVVLRNPNKISLKFIGKQYTFSELKDMVDDAAEFLKANGIKPSDRVGIMLPNSPAYVIMFFAICKIGAVVVQINPLYTSFEISNELSDSGSDVIITLDDFYERVATLYKKYLNKIIICKIQDYLPGAIRGLYNLGRVFKKGKVKIQLNKDIILYKFYKKGKIENGEAKIEPSTTPAIIQYTGGTTGTPKGAILTHQNLISNIYQINEWVPENYKKNAEVLAAIPFFHVYGMMTAMLFPIFNGMPITIIPDPRNTKLIISTMKKGKNITFPGIPTMYHSIMKNLKGDKKALSNTSLLFSGAAPMPEELESQFTSLTNIIIIEGYGLSESSPVVTITPVDPSKRKRGTVGFPIPNTSIRIVDIETGTKVIGVGESGEITVKGPQVMLGYLNKKEETDQVLRDGWLYTGDIGFVDDEGYIHIIDRKKDMIIAGGYNIYPREIEEVLLKNGKIEDAAVIGIKDPHRGETVKAYIVLKKDQNLTEKEVISYCSEKLAIYKIPKSVEFVDSLPKSLVGKVLRRELVERNERRA